MKRFWMVVLAAVCLSGLTIADVIDVPGSEPGTTVVAATNGTEYVGSYWWPDPPDGNSREYLFTYQNGTYTTLFPLPGLFPGDSPIMQINSSGAFIGYINPSQDGSFSFSSSCPVYDCVSRMVHDDFFANEMTPAPVFPNFYAWRIKATSIDDYGDIIGTFENYVQLECDVCVEGAFAIHDGSVYYDYQLYDDSLDPTLTVNEFTWDGTNLSIPEPSSILLLAPGLIFAVRLRKAAIR